MTACAALTPLQEHVRRVLHLAGISWHAALVSLVQLGCVALALVLLAGAQVPAIWRPFGALTIATAMSLGAGLLVTRGGAAADPAATAAQQAAEV